MNAGDRRQRPARRDERDSIEGVPVVETAAARTMTGTSDRWRAELSPGEATFVRRLEEQLRFETGDSPDAAIRVATAAAAERIPLPGFLKRPLMEMLLRDVHHYFFNVEYSPRPGEKYRIRDELQRRFLERVIAHAADRPHVIVCHSMGTILTYDCRAIGPIAADRRPITLGSRRARRGQEAVAPNGSRVTFPGDARRTLDQHRSARPRRRLDPRFANDYLRDGAEVVVDIRESSWGKWRHNIVKYLSGPRLRIELKRLLAGAQLELPAGARVPGSGKAERAAGDRESVTTAVRRGASRTPGAVAPLQRVAATELDAQALRKLDREELARLANEVVRRLEGVAATPNKSSRSPRQCARNLFPSCAPHRLGIR
jgi:hypothetical protein